MGKKDSVAQVSVTELLPCQFQFRIDLGPQNGPSRVYPTLCHRDRAQRIPVRLPGSLEAAPDNGPETEELGCVIQASWLISLRLSLPVYTDGRQARYAPCQKMHCTAHRAPSRAGNLLSACGSVALQIPLPRRALALQT